MVFQNNVLLGTSGSGTTAYEIDQSIRYNDPDNPKLGKTFSGAGTEETWTFSCWIKLGAETSNNRRMIFSAGSAGSNYGGAEIGSAGDNSLEFYNYVGGSYDWRLVTTQQFRDPAAWYHLVFVSDTTNSISSERARIYVNGQRVTDFSTESYPSASYANNFWMGTTEHEIGTSIFTTQNFDGYMAEIVNLDGTATDCSSFGEFNSSGIWIPKSVSGLTFGTNGFHIDGRDSADLGDDESGQGNDFTASGLAAHDQVSDSPTNSFSVMNPLANYHVQHTLKNGNLEELTSTNGSYYSYSINNIGMTSGKWYVEVLFSGSSAAQMLTGISDRESQGGTHYLGSQSYEYSYYNYNGKSINGSTQSTYGNTYTTGDIIGIALDLDNSKLYFSKNGTFQNSGAPTSGSTGTGALSITAVGSTENGFYYVGAGDYSGANATTYIWNFGQEGTFAGNITAGGNSDGNGIGNFKYSVPSGYLALCTKNLGS